MDHMSLEKGGLVYIYHILKKLMVYGLDETKNSPLLKNDEVKLFFFRFEIQCLLHERNMVCHRSTLFEVLCMKTVIKVMLLATEAA